MTSGTLASQTLDGSYKYSDEKISFENDSMVFDIQSNGGLTSKLLGQGQYTVIEEYLVVKASTFKGLRSHYEKKCEGKFGIKVHPADTLQNGYNVIYKQSDGNYQKKPSNQTTQIEIDYMGGDKLIIPYSNCYFYVSLYEGYIIENKTVVFKIHSFETSYLSLELITTNFEYKTISHKQLRKEEKKISRKFGADKYFKKFVHS